MSANGDDGHKSVEAAVANFLDETELTKKPKDPRGVYDGFDLLSRIVSQALS